MTDVREPTVHETDVHVETAYHPSGDAYTVAIGTCEGCDWTARGSEDDVTDAAWTHRLTTSAAAIRAAVVVDRHPHEAVFVDDEPGDVALMVRPYRDGSGRASLVIQGCDDDQAMTLLRAALARLEADDA